MSRAFALVCVLSCSAVTVAIADEPSISVTGIYREGLPPEEHPRVVYGDMDVFISTSNAVEAARQAGLQDGDMVSMSGALRVDKGKLFCIPRIFTSDSEERFLVSGLPGGLKEFRSLGLALQSIGGLKPSQMDSVKIERVKKPDTSGLSDGAPDAFIVHGKVSYVNEANRVNDEVFFAVNRGIDYSEENFMATPKTMVMKGGNALTLSDIVHGATVTVWRDLKVKGRIWKVEIIEEAKPKR